MPPRRLAGSRLRLSRLRRPPLVVFGGEPFVFALWVVRWLVRPPVSYRDGTGHGATVPMVWLVLGRPVVWDGPQSVLWCEVPDLVADGSSCLVPAPGRACVGRPVGRPVLERASHIDGADLEGSGDVVDPLVAVLCQVREHEVVSRGRRSSGLGVEPHGAGLAVVGDPVLDRQWCLCLAVLDIDRDERRLSVALSAQP